MATTTAQRARRRQLRWFVLIWIAITFIMGACTFFAIFVVLGDTNILGRSERNFALPTPIVNPTAVIVAVNSTAIPAQPTEAIAPTILPTDDPAE